MKSLIHTELELITVCSALISDHKTLCAEEKALVNEVFLPARASDLEILREEILLGLDPLGEAFARIRSPKSRRSSGAVYTPATIVDSMMKWLASKGVPDRIVDPGAGSGRFILSAGEFFPEAELIAVEFDPLAALMLRANIEVRGWADRTKILVKDYRQIKLPKCLGTTAFIGNPPYVRHHDIEESWKNWYSEKFATFGIKASALAGLHLHFFLQTRLLAKKGDIGAFITSAEWMDVNYGSALRRLLLEELGSIALHVLDPSIEAFPGTATTAAITCFRVGESEEPMRMRSVTDLSNLNGLTKGIDVPRSEMLGMKRWSIIVRPSTSLSVGEVELGEFFRVHRGQVTGANGVWIAGEHADALPMRIKIPTITKAKDLIQAGTYLSSIDDLKRVIDLPPDFDSFEPHEVYSIEKFLKWAKSQGADQSYVAQHRKAWWSVGLKAPAPILCTYMARRPPQFTLNECDARHINIAHGLYPRADVDKKVLHRIVNWLNKNINVESGRTYAGGLTKFEPKEIERLKIPTMETFK